MPLSSFHGSLTEEKGWLKWALHRPVVSWHWMTNHVELFQVPSQVPLLFVADGMTFALLHNNLNNPTYVSSYITDLSQGSQVTGSPLCERGNTNKQVSQMLRSYFGCLWIRRNTPSQRLITQARVKVLWPCVLMAFGSCSAVFLFFQICQIDEGFIR